MERRDNGGRERGGVNFPNVPPNSRVFIARLRSDIVSKRDLEEVFSAYGRILEIRMHPTYAFVQYDNPDSANRAIVTEKHQRIKGLVIGLFRSWCLLCTLHAVVLVPFHVGIVACVFIWIRGRGKRRANTLQINKHSHRCKC